MRNNGDLWGKVFFLGFWAWDFGDVVLRRFLAWDFGLRISGIWFRDFLAWILG